MANIFGEKFQSAIRPRASALSVECRLILQVIMTELSPKTGSVPKPDFQAKRRHVEFKLPVSRHKQKFTLFGRLKLGKPQVSI